MCFVNMFSQSMVCSFIFLIVSFEEQKFLILMESNLSIFSFVDYVLSLYIIYLCLTKGHKDFILCFRIFIVSDFTFSCMIHIELTFVFVYSIGFGSLFAYKCPTSSFLILFVEKVPLTFAENQMCESTFGFCFSPC